LLRIDNVQSENKTSHLTGERLSYAFNIKIIHRMLSVIKESSKINKTNLAGKAGLNYNRCVKYTDILLMLGWIKVIFEDPNYVTITENGIDIINKLSNSM